MIALRWPDIKRVEVKTGYMATSKNGGCVNYNLPIGKADRFDFLIVVLYDDGVKIAFFTREQGRQLMTKRGKERSAITFSMPIADLLHASDIFQR